jgi:CheY-like chemotaxis protein
VLVVDDNVDTATGLARLLTRRGYIVQVAYDGNSALAAARKLSPAIILLDIGLPGIDGYDVARHLREDPRCSNALVIALSGYGQDEDRRRSRAAGFDHHLVKPVSFDEVRTLLAQRF